MGAPAAADDLVAQVEAGQYLDVLSHPAAQPVVKAFVAAQFASSPPSTAEKVDGESYDSHISYATGLAALNAFLQANVTGPALEPALAVEAVFASTLGAQRGAKDLRAACLRSLEVDGSSAYAYVPHLELFALARFVFVTRLAASPDAVRVPAGKGLVSPAWMRLRAMVWHYRLLTQPSLGPGSTFNRAAQWSDVPSLQEDILQSLEEVEAETGEVVFLVEKANVLIMLGLDGRARETLAQATDRNGFAYALSGALGKRTRFQEKSTSQLVVLARSAGAGEVQEVDEEKKEDGDAVPEALKLNDDTLFEGIQFNKEEGVKGAEKKAASLPDVLKDLSPDEQPKLSPLDQIILLTEATLKDAFSPADTLTSEEILPFAVRVIDDESRNWQIYTQALLVRSRIEMHRSRTVERGVLQMQALVDQVVVDTSTAAQDAATEEKGETDGGEEQMQNKSSPVPTVAITEPDSTSSTELVNPNQKPKSTEQKPTSFFPAPKASESAPPQVRLQYIHALASPPRWHLESELAYAWAGVGSLVSALEIFKRLRLWAEVALCLATSGAAAEHDEDGRGGGGEEKARAVLRWRLFTRTDGTKDDPDAEDVVSSELKSADYKGPERDPAPSGAPRLYCILGDVENEPEHYRRAWALSKNRYARAQKSLGEHLLAQKDLEGAREAYRKAVTVNRMSPEMWSRLGDISLRLSAFEDAAGAYSRAIGAAGDVVGGEDARTWSNLGSALYSLYVERVEEEEGKKAGREEEDEGEVVLADDEEEEEEVDGTAGTQRRSKGTKNPATLLAQSLNAYKRGAALSRDNWRIWDNVITLASRLRPVRVNDIVQATRSIISIRKTEEALDDATLRLLLNEAVLPRDKPGEKGGMPGRGTQERAVCELLEEGVVPLITRRSELWEVVGRSRIWRGDWEGGIEAASRAWRAAMGGAGGGSSLGAAAAAVGAGGGKGSGNWLDDEEAWGVVVRRTDELVGVLENYGEGAAGMEGGKWRGKARSAVRGVMSKGRERWEGSEGWRVLEGLMDGLKMGGG